MHVKEEDILEPREPSLHPDDWASFNIKKVRVTSQKTGREVSLLSAKSGNPVKVTGKLEEMDDDLLHRGTAT